MATGFMPFLYGNHLAKKKILEKSKKSKIYSQKNVSVRITSKSLRVSMCVRVCVDYICVSFCVVVHVIFRVCLCMQW